MRTSILQFVHALVVLIVGIAVEEALPRIYGVGFPVLLASVLFLAPRRRVVAMTIIALSAGAMEDAVCALPMMLSASFFLAVAVMVRMVGHPRSAAFLAYPLYQVWMSAWTGGGDDAVFGRVLVALPIGALTALTVGAVLMATEWRAAVDEAG